MTPITRYAQDLNSEYEYRYKCSQKSVELINAAIEQNDLPTRAQHCCKFIEEPCKALCIISCKIIDIFCRALAPFCILIASGKLKKERCLFAVVNLFLLHPLSIIVEVAVAVMRIVFAFTGIFLPCLAAKGYKWSEQLHAMNWNLHAKIWKKIVPNSPDAKLASFRLEMNPSEAIQYLSKERSEKLHQSINILTDQKQMELDTAMKDRLGGYLEYLSKSQAVFDAFFTTNLGVLPTKIAKLLREIDPDNKESDSTATPGADAASLYKDRCKRIIEKAKKWQPEEIKSLFLEIKERFKQDNIIKIIKNEAPEYSEINGTLDVNSNSLDEVILERFGFGAALYPVY